MWFRSAPCLRFVGLASLVLSLAAGALCSCALRPRQADSALQEATGSAFSPAQARAMVDYHNRVRAEAGAGPLQWSPELARYAQERAMLSARQKRFAHLPMGRNPYGENLAQGGGAFGVWEACEGWHAEKALMPRGADTMSPALFRRGVGHYTQMIWGQSRQIGGGLAHYESGGVHWTVIVCCYDPPGNVMGQRFLP